MITVLKVARLLRALDALDRPPRVLGALSVTVVAITGVAAVEVQRMPAWARPDALGDRLFHRTFGALHLVALALGALFASATIARLRREGWLDHLLLAGAAGADIALAVALRAAAHAAALTALASPMVTLSFFYRPLPASLLASALASTLACASLGALVGVASASPRRAALAVTLLGAAGNHALGHSAADVVLSPRHIAPHGTLWWIALLTDGRASTALRRVGVFAPWWVVGASTPWLLDVAARRLVPARPSWRVALFAGSLLAVPMALAVHAVTRPLDRLACLHAALVAWTSLALTALDDELCLLVALGGAALLGCVGATGLDAARWLPDSAIASVAVAASVLLVASTLRRLSPRRGALVALGAVVAWCAVPPMIRELLGPDGAWATPLSPLGALELIAHEARVPGALGWREAAHHTMRNVYGYGTLLVTLAWFGARRAREVVR